MKVRSTFLASSVLLVLFAMFSVARADEPQEWPGFSKEKIGGIALGTAEAAAVKALGAAKSKAKAVNEGATGEWVSDWTFADGVTLTMTAAKEKGPYTVRLIALKSPSKLQTVEKIGIGSTLAEVKKAYGKALTDSGDGAWLVGTPYAGLLFSTEKDKVTAITFGPMAE